MKNRFGARLLALLMAFALLFPACNKMEAATMNLMKAEGTVAVADDKGQDVPIVENLGLYSGYDMATQLSSYAWINLDQVKLAKMDEQSEIEIQKDGKRLEILLKSGSVFFNVTKPLEEDETLNIRTSGLLVGIRGTCGWVSAEGGSSVHILEGTVAASLSDGTGEVPVTAGETGHLAPDGSVIVEKFTVLDVPDFVAAELEEDGALAKAVLDASGIDMAGRAANRAGITQAAQYLADGTPVFRYDFMDVGQDGQIQLDLYRQENGIWTPAESFRMAVVYNEQGREEDIRFYDEGGALVQHVRIIENGTNYAVIRKENLTNLQLSVEYTTYYNERNEKLRSEYASGDYTLYEYDGQGRLAKQANYSAAGEETGYYLFEYGTGSLSDDGDAQPVSAAKRAYEQVLAEYRVLAGEDLTSEDGWIDMRKVDALDWTPYPHISSQSDMVYYYGGADCYAYYDLDGNGVEELILGVNYDTGPMAASLYAFNGQDAVMPLRYDLYFVLLSDGLIVETGNGGAVGAVYRMGGDGCSMETVEDSDISLYSDVFGQEFASHGGRLDSQLEWAPLEGEGSSNGETVDFSLYVGNYTCAATGAAIGLTASWGSWTLSTPRPGDPAHLDTYSLEEGDGRLELRDEDDVVLLTLTPTANGLLVENTGVGGEFDHIVGEYARQ